jgi:hypothetical protein
MATQPKKSNGYSAVIAAICIIIYLFALVQASVRIYLSIDNCRLKAEQEFNNIASMALAAGMQGFMDERFIETMNRSLVSSDFIEALIISSAEHDIAIERQQGRAVTWVNNSPRFINRFTFSNVSHYRPLQINNIRNASIRAVAGAFDYYEISNILKETLLLILIGFALAFFTMLMQLLTGKPEQVYAHDETDHVSHPVKQSAEPRHKHKTPEKQETENIIAAETVPEAAVPTAEAVAKARVKTETAVKDAANTEAEKPAVPSKPEKAIEPTETEPEIIEVPETGPKGLYSPRSNIGWENYIYDRLDSELHRCSSTENDLTLVLMDFMDITNDEMYMQAAEEAVSSFSSRDLLFEHGKFGIIGILPGLSLETGIAKSEKFYQRIMERFPNNYSSASSLCIGLTSRSGRLLNADRLMFEGMEALKRAKLEPKTGIIAFKSDPEKYRDFIRTHS